MLKDKDPRTIQTETESYSIQTIEELSKTLDSLSSTGRIKGVGFDVFGTLISSLYSRSEQTDFLSKHVSEFLLKKFGEKINVDKSLKVYSDTRELIKSGRIEINNIPVKQQECPEGEVLRHIAKKYSLKEPKKLNQYINEKWLKFDLQNARPVTGMTEIVSKSIQIFGSKHVGLFSNNSCNKYHILTLLNNNGYTDRSTFDSRNINVSSEFGLKKYGVGIRKPNQLAFKDFASKMSLLPTEIAFIGDGGNDVLFATDSGGVGIRICFRK